MKKNQNKIMISEVNRIKELMGIRKKIFEAASGEPVTILEKILYKYLPDFINDAKFTQKGNVYKLNDDIIPKQGWDELNRLKKSPSSVSTELNNLSKESKNILFNLFTSNPKFKESAVEIYKDYMSD